MRRVFKVVCGVIVAPDKGILLAKRDLKRSHGGLWEFPGGKIEPEESDEGALKRELREELGIEIEVLSGKLRSTEEKQAEFEIYLRPLVCRISDGVPEAREHEALVWASVAALSSYAMPKADEPIRREIEKIGDAILSGTF